MALTPSTGWYASDDGLVLAWAAPKVKRKPETVRVFMDFAPIAEIVDGDSIINQTVTANPGSLTLANKAINGTRIEADLSAGLVDTEYQVIFTATLDSGAIKQRVGRIRVPA